MLLEVSDPLEWTSYKFARPVHVPRPTHDPDGLRPPRRHLLHAPGMISVCEKILYCIVKVSPSPWRKCTGQTVMQEEACHCLSFKLNPLFLKMCIGMDSVLALWSSSWSVFLQNLERLQGGPFAEIVWLC